MRVFDLFSKRQRKARGEMPDVYKFNELPQALRVQIVHIIRDAIGEDQYQYGYHYAKQAYEFINKTLCREYGVFELVSHPRNDMDSVLNFFLQEKSVEKALDVVELCFKVIDQHIGGDQSYRNLTRRELEPEEAITELNVRFKEHGIGFQFESSELIRVDSEFIHAEAVKPVFAILRGASFKGANEEFLIAHEHYRHGRYKECIVDSLKAFESTMKSICKLRSWPTKSGDTAKNLIATCIEKGLLPSYLEAQIGSLRSLLESGVPTIRNKTSGHGQGENQIKVPEYLARYALNLTASTILFLVEANSAAP